MPFIQKDRVLDDLETIKKIDRDDMLGHCMRMADYYDNAIELSERFLESMDRRLDPWIKKVKSIVVAGMGGSAIGGELLKGWMRDEIAIPIEISRDYDLPVYVGKETLVLLVSYSGDTEETLSTYIDAVNRGCMTLSITSNGELIRFSERLGTPVLEIPGGIPPRAALPYLFLPLPMILEKLDLITIDKREVDEALADLRRFKEELGPLVPTSRNEAKKLAYSISDRIPLILGYGFLSPVAHRFNTQINENSKLLAFNSSFPEINHNLIIGWELDDPFLRDIAVIILRDPTEPPHISERIEVTKSLAFKAGEVVEMIARGGSRLAKILTTTLMGDFMSVYLAILRGVDPSPVELIERLKRELGRKVKLIEKLKEDVSKISE